MTFQFCKPKSREQEPLIFNESIYRSDTSIYTKHIQSSIDTINWIEIRYIDLDISVKIPSKWKKMAAFFPVVSIYSDTSKALSFNTTYSFKILNQAITLEQYHKNKIKLHPKYGILVEDNPNPFFWTNNVYTSMMINPSVETHNMSLASWSFAFIHKNNLIEINLVTDTTHVAEMDLLFKNIINLVDSI